MQYIVDSIAPDGTEWFALNWAPGSEDYVVALPPENVTATVAASELTLTWDEANLAYPATWDTYKVLKNGNQIGISNNGNFTVPNPSSGIYTVSSVMEGWPVNDGKTSIQVDITINPVSNLKGELYWKREKYVNLTWGADGDGPFIIYKDDVKIEETIDKFYQDWLTPPFKGALYTVKNTEADPNPSTVYVSKH